MENSMEPSPAHAGLQPLLAMHRFRSRRELFGQGDHPRPSVSAGVLPAVVIGVIVLGKTTVEIVRLPDVP
jgi:hypothetical protein